MTNLAPEKATKSILNKLPGRRMRDVLIKRFGLKGGKRRTLEAIGKEYRITRERVRQIEVEAMKRLRKQEDSEEAKPIFSAVEKCLADHGGTLAEHRLFAELVPKKSYPHLAFLLNLSGNFHFCPEDEKFHPRWALNASSAASAENFLSDLIKSLEEKKKPVLKEELLRLAAGAAAERLNISPEEPVLGSLIASSKIIRPNPYGEYGLSHWHSIRPRGIRDKAHLALAKGDRPMHFTEIAKAVTKAGWAKKKAHPQTVHNELIKDERFVLVGRGLYALKEWGYEPGVVRDVIVSVLKLAEKPLTKEEVIRLVSEKRMVKPQTILLNLQNKSLFRRGEGGGYTLV